MKRKRRGQSLIFFLLFFLALASLLALILDFGFVLLSRRTMQSAVNSAALEGARDCNGEGREDAREVTRNVFDDDLDPVENLTTLGAGPEQSLIQRNADDRSAIGTGNRRDLYTNRHQYIYRPDPQLNGGNEVHGDFVEGSYLDDSASPTDHAEGSDYGRDDFTPDGDGEAFLARIRRTPERSGIANPLDRVDGTSSSGLGSPLLIGHLAPFVPSADGEFDVRRDGITIRTTAISDNKPVVHVGTADHDDLFRSVPFAYSVDDNNWYALPETLHNIGEQAVYDPANDEVDINSIPDNDAIGYASVVREYQGTRYLVGFQLIDRGTSKRQNASPRLQDAWATLSTLPPSTRDQIIAYHRELTNDFRIARVPALVRTIR